MLDDAHIAVGILGDLFAFTRSSPSLDELLVAFNAAASAVLVRAEVVDVRPGAQCARPPESCLEGGRTFVSRQPVLCRREHWGELRLTYRDGGPTRSEILWERLLAEVLGATIVAAGLENDAPDVMAGHALAETGDRPDPEDLLGVVLYCAEALDLMADESTAARLALVVSHIANAVHATSWSVGFRHERRLYEVAPGSRPAAGGNAGVDLLDFPARLRASEGGGFYADRGRGDASERMALEEGDEAVIGAGGYDLDGRSWVVVVRSDAAAPLERAVAVLFALVLAALSFPREATVPRPDEPWMREILTRARAGHGPQEDERSRAGR